MSYSISLYHCNRCPQPANSIVINASGVALNGAIASSFYARPLRALPAATSVYYNAATFELSYLTSSITTKINIQDLSSNTMLTDDVLNSNNTDPMLNYSITNKIIYNDTNSIYNLAPKHILISVSLMLELK